MFYFSIKNNTKMISKAIYYQAFIPKYNILNNGIDFTRTLQSINKYEDGFNVIIFITVYFQNLIHIYSQENVIELMLVFIIVN